ncbi:MAG: NAD(P)/FAD-dependent oxidoreductase [Candidatus Methanospirareceae archaeon]
MSYEVIVVGAGFAGLSSAISTAKRGIKTLLISPFLAKTVKDINTEQGLDALGIGPKTSAAYKDVAGCEPPFYAEAHVFRFISPAGKEMEVKTEKQRHFTMMTTEATEILFKRCLTEGVEYKKSVVMDFIKEGGKVEGVITDEGDKITSSITICACGCNLQLIRKLVKPYPRSLKALNVIVDIKSSSEVISWISGKRWVGDFGVIGAFLMPVGKNKAVLAVPTENYPVAYDNMRKIATKHPVISKEVIKVHERTLGGTIPLGLSERSYGDGFLIVGDAAGHFRPLGGIGTANALRFGKIAGEVASKYIDDPSSDNLIEFEKRWKEDELGEKILNSIPLLDLLREKVSDDVLEEAFSVISSRGIERDFYLELAKISLMEK